VQIQLYKNGSSTFFTTFWVNVGLAWDGIVKNIESILLNLAAGMLEWYVTVGYTAPIGCKNTNSGTTCSTPSDLPPAILLH